MSSRLAHLLVTLAACSSPSANPAEPDVMVSPDASLDGIVEIKIDIAPIELATLGLDASNVHATQDIWFYDSADLALLERGAILRARKVHDDPDDSTVKMRPLSADQTAPGWLSLPGAKCEIDRTLVQATSACSLTADTATGRIDAVAAGGPIDALYTTDQLVFLGSVAGVVDFGELVRLGPISSTEWKLAPKTLPPISVEYWVVANRLSVLEVSTRAPALAADSIAAALLDWLAQQGIAPSAEQGSKTRAALEALLPH